MNKIKVIILRNERDDDHILWIKACEDYKEKIEYSVIDLTKNNWFEEIISRKFDVLLAKPGGLTSQFKQLYDERIYILSRIPGCKIYPSAEEIFIYENKRFFSYWLKANGLPHPKTNVFYYKEEADEFVKNSRFSLVAKVNIGASGSGVKILQNKNDALKYINDTFTGKGAVQRWGPNIKKRGLVKRGLHYLNKPSDINKKLNIYRTVKENPQKEFVIFQEYIPHDFEWRIVAIGDSYFAHKKMKSGEKASGLLIKNYDNPPLYLFDFAKNIMARFNFTSQSIDVFEREPGDLLINEMQCIFGQSDDYQMLVDGKPGRYRYINNRWVFEEGDFNKNESYNLRLENLLKSYKY